MPLNVWDVFPAGGAPGGEDGVEYPPKPLAIMLPMFSLEEEDVRSMVLDPSINSPALFKEIGVPLIVTPGPPGVKVVLGKMTAVGFAVML